MCKVIIGRVELECEDIEDFRLSEQPNVNEVQSFRLKRKYSDDSAELDLEGKNEIEITVEDDFGNSVTRTLRGIDNLRFSISLEKVEEGRQLVQDVNFSGVLEGEEV